MEVVVILPAFQPSSALPALVRALHEALTAPVVVVDDGSDATCRALFDAVAAMPDCVVLRHEANRGKGAALKTAFAFVVQRFPECVGVVTADADGQHAPEDVRRLAEALVAEPAALHLGVRKFSLRTTPFRSWWGNRWTSLLFGLLFRKWIVDTQTGLRAFRHADIPFFLSIPGDGYDYEMAALARTVRVGKAVRTLPIRTIYETPDVSSHFQPLRDTIRIYKALFRSFFSMKERAA